MMLVRRRRLVPSRDVLPDRIQVVKREISNSSHDDHSAGRQDLIALLLACAQVDLNRPRHVRRSQCDEGQMLAVLARRSPAHGIVGLEVVIPRHARKTAVRGQRAM